MIQSRSKRELRTAILYNVLGSEYVVSTFTSNGTSTTASDTALVGGDDNYNGWWLIPRAGTDDGTIVRVTDYDETGGALENLVTFTPTVNTDSVLSAGAYEMMPDRVDPKMLHSFMDDAMLDVTGRVFDPEEDLSLHLYSDRLRYDVPSQFSMINRLEERVSVRSVVVSGTSAVWTTIDGDVTATIDSEVQVRGGSLKLVIAAGVAAGDDLATNTISTVDISRYTHLEFWIRSTNILSAGDLNIILSDAGGVEETLSVPAVATADTWTFHRIAFASPENNTAITTIAIDFTVDGGAYTLWVEDFKAVDNDSGDWQRINTNRYDIDVQARDIVFKSRPGYRLLKIKGGDKPVLFSAAATIALQEATASEVDDYYVIAYTTASILGTEGFNDGSTNATRRLGMWQGRAELAKAGFPPLINVRKFS